MKVLSIQRRLIVANTSASILDKFVEEGRGHVGLSGMHTCAWAPYWMTALSARCWCYRLPSSAPSWPAQTWSSQTPWRYGWAPWGRRAYHWTAALSPWRGGCASELACAAPRVRPRRAKGRMEAWGHVPRRPPPPPTPSTKLLEASAWPSLSPSSQDDHNSESAELTDDPESDPGPEGFSQGVQRTDIPPGVDIEMS